MTSQRMPVLTEYDMKFLDDVSHSIHSICADARKARLGRLDMAQRLAITEGELAGARAQGVVLFWISGVMGIGLLACLVIIAGGLR